MVSFLLDTQAFQDVSAYESSACERAQQSVAVYLHNSVEFGLSGRSICMVRFSLMIIHLKQTVNSSKQKNALLSVDIQKSKDKRV